MFIKPTAKAKSAITIHDISQINSKEKINRTFFSCFKKKPVKHIAKKSNKYSKRDNINAVTEYIILRKLNILLFFIVSLLGIFVGIFYINDLDAQKLNNLKIITEKFNLNISSSEMILRIFNSLFINASFVFVVFLSGLTIFAPIICCITCLIKGILCGYSSGVIFTSSFSKFDLLIFLLLLVFNVITTLVLILSASESLGFSVFLMKNEESYKNSFSFSNIRKYSSRQFLFLFVLSLFTILQTVLIPLVYSYYY